METMNECSFPLGPMDGLQRLAEESPQTPASLACLALDALSAHVAILDESGTIVAVNRAWREFAEGHHRASAGMCGGANYIEACKAAAGSGNEGLAAIADGIRAVVRGARSEYVFELPHCSSQDHRWFNARVTRFLSGGSAHVVVTHEDVTERKHAEEAMRTSETRYRALFETSRDAMMTLAPPSWQFTSGNPAVVAMFGVRDEADFVSRAPWEYSPKRQPDGRDSVEKAKEMIETAMREGSHFFEWMHSQIDGTEFPTTVLLNRLELDGKTVLQSTIRNITQEKRLEEERERAAAEIRDLYENAPCGYHSVDKDGVLVRVNNTELSWLGYTREELVGKKRFRDLMTSQSQEIFKTVFPTLKERGWVSDVEYELIRADGTTFPVALNAVAIKDADGHFLMTRCTMFDITDRKRTEAALRESTETIRSQIESAFDVIFTLNRECEFVFVSPAWELHLGHPVQRVIGQPFQAFVHPDDAESCVEYLLRVLKTGQGETSPPYRFKHAKGEWRSFVANGTPHVDSKGETQFIGLAMLLPSAKKSAG